MKKIIVFCICFLLLCCMTVSASAASGMLVVDTISAKPGESVDVNIVAEKNPGIVATLIRIEYDASALTLTGADNGTVFPDGTQQFGKDIAYIPYTLLWEDGLSTENRAEEGVLATLHFDVKNDAVDGKYEIQLQMDNQSTFDVDLNTVAFILKNGSVQIGDAHSVNKTMLIVSCATGVPAVGIAVVTVVLVKRKKKEAAE